METLCHIYNLLTLYHFLIVTLLHTLLVCPHPNMYTMVVIFILVVAPAHLHNFMLLMQPFIESVIVHS